MKDFLIELFALLNAEYNYAVLRNFDGLPERIDSRDIDLLIAKPELKRLKPLLPELAGKHGCRILYTNSDNQFFTIVFGDGDANLFQLDFQYNFAWMGIDLLDEREVLKKRLFNGRVYHLDADDIFLPKYLYSRILGAKYPEKYTAAREDAVSRFGDEIDRILNRLSLNAGGLAYWDAAGKWKLRFRSFIAAFRSSPWQATTRMTDFLFQYFWSLFFRRGMMVSFSGPDGSGKTTVIELVCDRFLVNDPHLLHFRPTLWPNLGEIGAQTGIVRDVDRNFDRPHRGGRKGKLSSLIRLGYYSSDYIIGYLLKIMPHRWRKEIVFFDRYFTDIIVDGERSSIFLNCKFLAWLRHFIPSCEFNFLFKVDPERILTRKQELSKERIELIYFRMEYLASRDRRYYWIDNNGTPEQAVKQIIGVMLEKRHPKYVKKLSAQS